MLSTVENKNYIDVTNDYLKNVKTHKGRVIKAKYFKSKDGMKYYVDNKYVKFNTSKEELEIAKFLAKTFGGDVYLVPKVDFPGGIKSPDFLWLEK